MHRYILFFFFFFNDTATTEIYTLSLHDALPISPWPVHKISSSPALGSSALHSNLRARRSSSSSAGDRKSTRLNSSHSQISYAVFCLKKKKKQNRQTRAHTRSYLTHLRVTTTTST